MSDIIERAFEEELESSYLLYSLSVIISRAIPDARDGLKPVQRRILYSMLELGLRHNSSFKKSARIVGEVMGKYHPHGDVPIYEALVRMAQDFSMRYPLVNGQGNFGSIDRDPPAAMRYTEARMTEIAEYMLLDINKNTVDFVDNFDGSLKEPVVLPTRLPALLMNGAEGIAVGMSTKIPPHNLTELIEGLKFLIDNPEASVEELMNFIKGPDFPTGGIITDGKKFKELYETGKGKFTIRAKYHVEREKSINKIVVTEIPYGTSKADIIEKIANYVIKQKENGRDVGIKNIRDETDKRGMRVVIELKKSVEPEMVIEELFKHTDLEISYPAQFTVVVGKKPQLMNLKELMKTFIDHRIDVVIRRTKFLLESARKRAHILEGLMKALKAIDTVVEIIRSSNSPKEALQTLMEIIKVSEEQAKAILDMRLSSLSRLESQKLQNEYDDLMKNIREYNEILNDKTRLMNLIKDELEEVKSKFGDKRKTQILFEFKPKQFKLKDENVVVVLSDYGYMKVFLSSEYNNTKKTDRSSKGMNLARGDAIRNVIYTSRFSDIMIITSFGRAYKMKVVDIEKFTRGSTLVHISRLIKLQEKEKVKNVFTANGIVEKQKIVFFTKHGKVKKVDMKEFENLKKSGIKAISLDSNDEVVESIIIEDEDTDVIVVTKKGYALRFNLKEVRTMGRNAAGVKAVKISQDNEVIGAVSVDNQTKMLLVTERGFAKRMEYSEFRRQSRGGVGLKCIGSTKLSGKISAVLKVKEDDVVVILTEKGKIKRFLAKDVPILTRINSGRKVTNLSKNDKVLNVAVEN